MACHSRINTLLKGRTNIIFRSLTTASATTITTASNNSILRLNSTNRYWFIGNALNNQQKTTKHSYVDKVSFSTSNNSRHHEGDFADNFRFSSSKAKYFSINLLLNAIIHIEFLKVLHGSGITLKPPTKKNLQRYRDLWLPLVHKYPKLTLIPPIDIAWLWHCHRLAPLNYEEYLKNKFSESCPLLDPNPPFAVQLSNDDSNKKIILTQQQQKNEKETIRIWNQEYPSESFFIPLNCAESINNDYFEHVSPITSSRDAQLDTFLQETTNRQLAFLWQVSSPSFDDIGFLKQGVENYYKFLQLKPSNQFIVPTYQIDLIWHTHMLSSLSVYHKDCQTICRQILNHNDSLTDRTKGGKLDLAFTATKRLWLETHGCEYTVARGMYRGEPPTEYFDPSWIFHQQSSQSIGHLHPFSRQMIEQVHGASSSNLPGQSTTSTKSRKKNEWTMLHDYAPDGTPAFIKSNNDEGPFKPNYLYGEGSLGSGYYHISTRDAYQIFETCLVEAIKEKEATISAQKFSLVFFSFMIAGISSLSIQGIFGLFVMYSVYKIPYEKERIKDLEEQQEYVKTTYQADKRVAICDMDTIADEIRQKRIKKKKRDRKRKEGGGCGGSCDGGGCGGGCD